MKLGSFRVLGADPWIWATGKNLGSSYLRTSSSKFPEIPDAKKIHGVHCVLVMGGDPIGPGLT